MPHACPERGLVILSLQITVELQAEIDRVAKGMVAPGMIGTRLRAAAARRLIQEGLRALDEAR